jgi:ketosteroid isomerase-like protein
MKNLYFYLVLVTFSACSGSSTQQVIDADLAFSDLSASQGMNHAFLTYAHDSAVMLRKNHRPIIGPAELHKLFNTPDSSFTLTWKPSYASMAQSGELAYTYGIYTLTTGQDTSHGTYVTIWKKTAQGWRWVLDSGNAGLEPETH